MFLKEKMKKKKSVLKTGVVRPKGNGIKDGNEKRLLCLCRKLLGDFNHHESKPDNFAFAFAHFSKSCHQVEGSSAFFHSQRIKNAPFDKR